MTKEEKIQIAKRLYEKLGIQTENVISNRIDEINADICMPSESQRGTGGIIIGDDGSYLVCGSIKPVESYIENYKNGERSTMNSNELHFYKNNEADTIWWVENPEKVGEHLFSFDKEKIFNLFQDYPQELTEEQKEIFDKENPYWADFFKDRK